MASRSWLHRFVRRLTGRLTDAAVQVLLRPQIRMPAAAGVDRASEIEQRTDELNAAAEAYFAQAPYRAYLLGKPYSDPFAFPRYLFNLGVLLHYLRVGPGDRVLELGAGSCWISHFLNLHGCRTVSVDVSATALRLGRELFERDARTRWDLDPLFLPYDGYRLPLDAASVDRIVIHDAYHHIPNPGDVLREMQRVLRPGGIVAMSEPGREHSSAPTSQREVEETAVLENDVVLEDLEVAALDAGFSRVTFVPVALRAPEIPASEQAAFLRGKHFSHFWRHQKDQLLANQFILLYKGETQLTTRQPGRHAAEIRLLHDTASETSAAAASRLSWRCQVRNSGDSLWLHGDGRFPGETLLGARLRPKVDGEPQGVWREWGRAALSTDLEPGQQAELELDLTVPAEPGTYWVRLDMVAENVTWFSDQGSQPFDLEIEVLAPGSG